MLLCCTKPMDGALQSSGSALRIPQLIYIYFFVHDYVRMPFHDALQPSAYTTRCTPFGLSLSSLLIELAMPDFLGRLFVRTKRCTDLR